MSAARSVLVTGASGFIGRSAVTALRAAGWNVTRGVRAGAPPAGDGAIALDLADAASVLRLADGYRFDAIVHLGARLDLAVGDGRTMYAPNVLGTACMAELARRWNARLVFASTVIVHGVHATSIGADSSLHADTPYAHGKWLGEQLIVASGIDHCILRIGGVFGAAGPGHLGINRAIDSARRGVPPTQVASGKALRSYVYVEDVATAIVFALAQQLQGIHLLAGHEPLSIAQMLREICCELAPQTQPTIVPGAEAADQVVAPSAALPRTRSFRQAIVDIRRSAA